MLGLFVVIAAVPAFAHEGKDKKKHTPKVKHAIHELDEAEAILAKVPADADGHIANAKQSISQAKTELTAVKS